MSYSATYSPDDNKLRLYASERLPRDLYDRVRRYGFIWAPKQDLFVAPMWTPEREDFLIELCGEIGDEDTSLCERAEERAERFEDYSEKREADADRARAAVSAIADNIPLGQPILIGHHSERHARKDAERIENGMRKAVRMWETSKYWTSRAAGAISHAKYKERPDVRARRIKKIEADRRRDEKGTKEATMFIKLWQHVDDPKLLTRKDGGEVTSRDRAMFIANRDHIHKCFTLAEYPRPEGCTSDYEGSMSLWSALDSNIITWEQARDIAIPCHERGNASRARWMQHYDNRLAYERAMLGETGYIVPPKNPSRAVLPILNYAGEVQYKNRYIGDTITSQAHGMTAAEYAAINKDYKGTFVSADGTHRVRSAMIKHALMCIYLTDKKQHTKPGTCEPTTREQQETQTRIERAQEKLDQQLAHHASIRAHNRAVIDAHRSPRKERTEKPADIAAMQESLKAGVQIVSAPQLFPTPPDVAARMVELADIGEGQRVLEPSAGTGALAWEVVRNTRGTLLCVEYNYTLAEGLTRMGYNVHRGDFLQCNGEIGTFDRIVMNPPFKNGEDIKHITHALRMLNDGGRLVALCADGPRQQRELQPLADSWEPLPAGTFSGTGVNAAMLVITK